MKCGNCKTGVALLGHSRCERCARNNQRSARKTRTERLAARLCVFCGAAPAEPQRTGCRPCLDRQSDKRYLAKYGLSRADKLTACEVCGSTIRLVIDHCHKHGHVRGTLCDRCNVILGRAHDQPGLLRKLADWIVERGSAI
jgi:hypothetical protein